MSDFTIELRRIESLFYSEMQAYPIYDENHREELNLKIFRHYKYREIGYETVDMFLDRLAERMNLIMPAYNELYRTADINYDPLETVDMRTESENFADATADSKTESGSQDVSTSRASTDSGGETTNYEMPQTQLGPNENYATAAVQNTSTSKSNTGSEASQSANSETGSTSHSQDTGNVHQHGRGMPAQELIARERDLIVNIDAEIVAELSDLFMSIWSSNTPYSYRGYFR